jgi:hypothetical protein
MAIMEGKENITSKATWYTGTRLARISFAIKSIWFTKNAKKKNKKHIQKARRISLEI